MRVMPAAPRSGEQLRCVLLAGRRQSQHCSPQLGPRLAVELARRLEQTGVKLRGPWSAEAERKAAVPDAGQLAARVPRSGPRRSGSTPTCPCPSTRRGRQDRCPA